MIVSFNHQSLFYRKVLVVGWFVGDGWLVSGYRMEYPYRHINEHVRTVIQKIIMVVCCVKKKMLAALRAAKKFKMLWMVLLIQLSPQITLVPRCDEICA